MRRNLDVLAAAVLAVTSAAVVVLVPTPAVRIVFALPLLFVLPGFSLTAALFPDRLDPARRLLLILGFGLCTAILGALALDLTFGLRRSSWAVLLAVVTCAGGAIAARRRTGPGPAGIRLPNLAPLDIALLVIAIAVVSGAVVLARTPLTARNVIGYTALSIRPARGAGGERIVHVQVTSGQLRKLGYRLELHLGRGLYNVRHLTIAPGQTWRETVRLTPKQIEHKKWIRARLYRDDRPDSLYRSVRIRARPWPS